MKMIHCIFKLNFSYYLFYSRDIHFNATKKKKIIKQCVASKQRSLILYPMILDDTITVFYYGKTYFLLLKLKTKSFLYSTTRRHDDAFASEALICYDATITARVPTPAQARKLTALEDINHQSSFVGLLIQKKV